MWLFQGQPISQARSGERAGAVGLAFLPLDHAALLHVCLS